MSATTKNTRVVLITSLLHRATKSDVRRPLYHSFRPEDPLYPAPPLLRRAPTFKSERSCSASSTSCILGLVGEQMKWAQAHFFIGRRALLSAQRQVDSWRTETA